MKLISRNREDGIPSSNDGVFAREETQWGKHLGTLQASHGELIGISNSSANYSRIYANACRKIIDYDSAI